MKIEFGRLLAPRVLGIALIVVVVLLVITFGWILLSAPTGPDPASLLAEVTVVPMPSATKAPAASPTYDPYAPTPTSTAFPGQFEIGAYVQISGTQGQGLRVRSGAGLSGSQLFLGFDTEAYTIVEGPVNVDGHIWYHITAVNDQTRTGWAASDFLTLIPKP